MTRVTLIFFFFQAEDGIRDVAVTGVQTCALPILHHLPQPTPWPRVSFGSWRLWDAYVVWPNVEPQKGQWDFSHLDGYISLAESHSVEILLPLGLTPAWASSRPKEKSGYEPGNAAEPRNISDWSEYVRSEEHTSELQSRLHLVCRLLLEKKKIRLFH